VCFLILLARLYSRKTRNVGTKYSGLWFQMFQFWITSDLQDVLIETFIYIYIYIYVSLMSPNDRLLPSPYTFIPFVPIFVPSLKDFSSQLQYMYSFYNNVSVVMSWGWPCHSSGGWRPGFDPRSVHVGFVVDKVALGQVSHWVLRFSPVNFIPPVLHFLEKW
jgi:hypothetical protein